MRAKLPAIAILGSARVSKEIDVAALLLTARFGRLLLKELISLWELREEPFVGVRLVGARLGPFEEVARCFEAVVDVAMLAVLDWAEEAVRSVLLCYRFQLVPGWPLLRTPVAPCDLVLASVLIRLP